MVNLLNHNRLDTTIGNWDWQPQILKEQFGELRPYNLILEFVKENDMLTRIGIRLDKSRYQVIRLLQKLSPFKRKEKTTKY